MSELNILNLKDITHCEQSIRDEIRNLLKKEKERLMKWPQVMDKFLKENNISHIVYFARQASPFESLLTGYYDGKQKQEQERPTQSHISVSSAWGFPYTPLPDRTEENIKELKRILKIDSNEKILLFDHKIVSGRSLSKVISLIDDLSKNHTNHQLQNNYETASYRELMGGFPARVPWDIGDINPNLYRDDNNDDKGLIAIEFNGAYDIKHDFDGDLIFVEHNNPDPIKIVNDPILQRNYFYLRQILYEWGYEVGMNLRK